MAANTKAAQLAVQKELMDKLAELGGQIHGDDTIVTYDGNQILIPEGMELLTLHKITEKKIHDEQQEYTVVETFNYRPHDGARAVRNVLRDYFGWATGMATKSFFGAKPPELISIQTGVDEYERVPWGWMELPQFEGGKIYLGESTHPEYGLVFSVHVQVRKKFEGKIAGLFNLIRDYLRNDSIYRGKAITASETPEFIDLGNFNPDDVIYTREVTRKLKTYVWANIWYPQQLRDSDEMKKRLTVVHGDYGVGKTLIALLTAYYCEQERINDGELIGFIFVRPGIDDWQYAMQMAKLYGRCIIFIEDIDTIMDTTNPREISKVLDQLDGMLAKGSDVSMIFTTNHIGKIHKGVLRPGRTDGEIEIGSMDLEGVERFAQCVIGEALANDINFHAVFQAMEGYTPAYVREVWSRAKRTSLVNHNGMMGIIETQDLIDAANDLRPQLERMKAAPELTVTRGVDGALIDLFKSTVNAAVVNHLEGADIVDFDGDPMYQIRLNR